MIRTERFRGEICGFGTTSGHRIVIGRWPESPFGPFADVMWEAPDGTRTLLAPSQQVADFVSETYVFDVVRLVPVTTERDPQRLVLDAGGLRAEARIGSRSGLGRLLRAVPGPVACSPIWCTAIDPVARIVMQGVRTKGTAGNDRREFYGATDQHRLDEVTASLDGADLGGLADVWPPVRFGFSSTPRTPSIVAVTTTIRRAADEVGCPVPSTSKPPETTTRGRGRG